MGYSTQFEGELKFTTDLKASELAELSKFLGADCREHPEWGASELSYIDLELTDDFSGLKWDGSEKTYELVEKINLVIENMQKKYPDFGLTGELLAQGEEVGDIWKLSMENNIAHQREIKFESKKLITCPHCEEKFFLEDDKFTFVFTGFRNEFMSQKLSKMGHQVVENVSKSTTHLIMKNTSKDSVKKVNALKYGCTIWSIEELEKFLK